MFPLKKCIFFKADLHPAFQTLPEAPAWTQARDERELLFELLKWEPEGIVNSQILRM